MLTTAPLHLLPTAARPIRPAHHIPRLDRGGPNCRVLFTSEMMDAIGEPRLASASVTFDRLTASSASGSAVEAGVAYDFDVTADGDVFLWRDDRRVPRGQKAPLHATILAVFRTAEAEQALDALTAVVDQDFGGRL